MRMEGEEQFLETRVWEATGQPDNSYLVESGQIMKFRVGVKIGEDDDSDRFYVSSVGKANKQ